MTFAAFLTAFGPTILAGIGVLLHFKAGGSMAGTPVVKPVPSTAPAVSVAPLLNLIGPLLSSLLGGKGGATPAVSTDTLTQLLTQGLQYLAASAAQPAPAVPDPLAAAPAVSGGRNRPLLHLLLDGASNWLANPTPAVATTPLATAQPKASV